MDVWETEAHPWLIDEIAAVREWTLQRNRPFLGVCLGLQLLAKALGGEVGLAREAEVGFGRVELNALGLCPSHDTRPSRRLQGDAVGTMRR